MSLHQPFRCVSRIAVRRPFVCDSCIRDSSFAGDTRHRKQWRAPKAQSRSITQNHLRKMKLAETEWKERDAATSRGDQKSMLEILEERGFVNQIVGNRDEFNNVMRQRRAGAYCGVDPTAESLHIGHMVPFMALGWLYIHGYPINFLLGGFTARIGDPEGRLAARSEVERTRRVSNMNNMFEQLKRLATTMEKYADRRGYKREWAWRRAVLNNSQWWTKVTVREYMTMLGKYVRIGPMLGRDSVKNRLEKGDGMSYAEFSYPLIQGWDWWHQYTTGTQIQIGGADQFGNILAGAEAVKSMVKEDTVMQTKLLEDYRGLKCSSDPFGFTVPLLTTSSGEKFGKSAGNAIWIDKQLTSSFDLYQFFLRSADDDVEKYLRLLTFIPLDEIQSVMIEHKQDESKRVAQHLLAKEFVELVHGLSAAEEAANQHRMAFSQNLTLDEIRASMSQFTPTSDGRPDDINPSINKHAKPLDMDSAYNLNLKLPQSLVIQQPLARILWSAGLVASRSEGQRMINAKGVYIGGKVGKNDSQAQMDDHITYIPATDSKWSFVEPYVLDGKYLVLRTGKWKKKFIEIVSDAEYEASGMTCPGWGQEEETAADPAVKADLAGERMYRDQARESKMKKEAFHASKSRRDGGHFGRVAEAKR